VTLDIDFDQDIADSEADLSAVLTVDGNDITVTKSETDEEATVDDDEEFLKTDVRVVARVSAFTDAGVGIPPLQKTVTLDGTKYHVETRSDCQSGAAVELGLNRI